MALRCPKLTALEKKVLCFSTVQRKGTWAQSPLLTQLAPTWKEGARAKKVIHAHFSLFVMKGFKRWALPNSAQVTYSDQAAGGGKLCSCLPGHVIFRHHVSCGSGAGDIFNQGHQYWQSQYSWQLEESPADAAGGTWHQVPCSGTSTNPAVGFTVLKSVRAVAINGVQWRQN